MFATMPLEISQARELAKALLERDVSNVQPFGSGKFSEVFMVDTPDGRYVLRVAPPDSLLQLFYEYRMMRQEPAIHARLLAETSVPVPPIAAHDFSRSLIDRDYLIMPLLPGTPLGAAGLASVAQERAHRQWGGHVAQIHTITDPENRFGDLGEHECMAPQPSWAEAFTVMYRRELDDIVGCGIYDGKTADDAMKLLEDNLDAFDNCRTSRLLHGDLWVTNLLVEPDGRVTGVIDFDRACWGDVEWDFAIAEYCGVTQPAFWEGYGRGPENLPPDYARSDNAAVRRMFYLLYEHQKYIVISMSIRRSDSAGARRYARASLAAMENFRRTGKADF